MKDLELSRKLAEQNNRDRIEEVDGIRSKIEQEEREYREELNQLRKAAEDKVRSDMQALRNQLHGLKSSQDKDTSQMEQKISNFRSDLEKMKDGIVQISERWQAVAQKSATRKSAAQTIEALLRKQDASKREEVQ